MTPISEIVNDLQTAYKKIEHAGNKGVAVTDMPIYLLSAVEYLIDEQAVRVRRGNDNEPARYYTT